MARLKILLLLLTIQICFGQEKTEHFVDKLKYEIPDPLNWELKINSAMKGIDFGLIAFEKKAPDNKQSKAGMAIVFTKIPDDMDLQKFSIRESAKHEWKVIKKYETGELTDFTNSVSYEAVSIDEKESYYIVHAVHENIGIQVMCVATKKVFKEEKVEFRKFIKSVFVSSEKNRNKQE